MTVRSVSSRAMRAETAASTSVSRAMTTSLSTRRVEDWRRSRSWAARAARRQTSSSTSSPLGDGPATTWNIVSRAPVASARSRACSNARSDAGERSDANRMFWRAEAVRGLSGVRGLSANTVRCISTLVRLMHPPPSLRGTLGWGFPPAGRPRNVPGPGVGQGREVVEPLTDLDSGQASTRRKCARASAAPRSCAAAISTHPLDVDLARNVRLDRQCRLPDADDGGGTLLLEADPGPGPEADVREPHEPRRLAGHDVHHRGLLPDRHLVEGVDEVEVAVVAHDVLRGPPKRSRS